MVKTDVVSDDTNANAVAAFVVTTHFTVVPAQNAPELEKFKTQDVTTPVPSVICPPESKLLASSDDVLGSGDTELITLTKRISLRPGKPRLMPLSFVVPSGVAAGTYRLLVQIDSANAIAESNETNNVVASATAFTVS